MILYKMLFLRSPYKDTENYSVLRDEILSYPGYVLLPSFLLRFLLSSSSTSSIKVIGADTVIDSSLTMP